MAELLDVTTMMAPAYEPKRANNWVLEWEGLDVFLLKTFARPSINLGEIVIDYINTKRYFAGKAEWATINIVSNDAIQPSAAQKFMEWIRLIHSSVDGRDGYKEFYAARNFRLKVLDRPGAVQEQWDFINIFPTSCDFGGLDYGSAEPLSINCTLRFDMALLQY